MGFGLDFQHGAVTARKPRVLVVGPLFPSGGGVGMVHQTLLGCGLDESFDMQILSTARVKVGEGKQGTLALINVLYYVRHLLMLLGIMLFRRPDILHESITDGPGFWKECSFMVVGRAFGVKVVGHLHGNPLEKQYRSSRPFVQRMMRGVLSAADVLVVLNEHWRDFLIETVRPSAAVIIVPNPVDMGIAEAMDRYDRAALKDDFVVLFMGWLGTRKGLPDALQAVPLVRREIPDARFVFAGVVVRSEKDKIEPACLAAERAGGVVFPGFVAGKEKLALLSQASVLILPSHTENLPMSVIEAMAMGLPVVATPVGGVPEVVSEGHNGFLIQPGDYQALADRILRLARDPKLRQAMGQANIAKARQQYHPAHFAARMRNIYHRLLASGEADSGTVSSPIES